MLLEEPLKAFRKPLKNLSTAFLAFPGPPKLMKGTASRDHRAFQDDLPHNIRMRFFPPASQRPNYRCKSSGLIGHSKVKAGSRSGLLYDGERTAKGLWKYIKKHASKAQELRERLEKRKGSKKGEEL